MNPAQARQLIKETFTQAFDKARFRTFAINLLNHVDEDKKGTMAVPDAFAAHVKSCQRLGSYAAPQSELLDVLIVHLTEDYKIERTRTALRDFVAHKLKRGDNYKEAALVAFVPPDAGMWRLSYVRMQYESVRDPKTGVIKPEERPTPARRFSYLVGDGESCHTAQTRFLGLLQDTVTDPVLAQIEEAFSVEAVTKEFFAKYVELFGDINASLEKLVGKDKTIRDEFNAKGVNTVDFAKKLMGQIVFLYFLQKKGWLGVEKGKDWGTGPRDFLRKLVGQASSLSGSANIFNDILEPLFYDTLATDRGHEAWCNRFKCRMPFLNGGLFEPLGDYDWKKTDIILPNRLFTNSEHVEEGIIGTGVMDVFDRYNFTVNEAEPLEKEVAIDPEMLGKVFENLIEENRRKGLGSFYTPREIVHYMCQESLINYLDTAVNRGKDIVPRAEIETFVRLGEQISHYESVEAQYAIKMPKSIQNNAKALDDALGAITVCDPAVGSGAFPVGMMTEIVRARSSLTPYFDKVGQASSLPDDDSANRKQDACATLPRTPYHFKRHAIQNCLYGVDIDAGAVEIAKLRLWLSLVVDEDDVKQIKPLPNLDYKIVVGNSLMGFPFKSQRHKVIEAIKLKFFDEPDHNIKVILKRQIDDELSACFAAAKKSLGYEVTFDFEVWFSEVFDRKKGFDVVIANPPYVRQEGIKELKPILKSQFQCYTGTADLYVYFYERSVRVLRNGGVLAFISSNSFLNSGFGTKLRTFLKESMSIHVLIDFAETRVFAAITEPCIWIASKGATAENTLAAVKWNESEKPEGVATVVRQRALTMSQSQLGDDGWQLESPAVLSLLERMRGAGKPLGECANVRLYLGIKTGLNEAFVVDRTTRNRLVREHKSSADILTPFLRGRDVKRWCAEFAEQYIIKIESSENKNHPWSDKREKEAEAIFAKSYPAIHEHFQSLEKMKLDAPDARGCRNKLEQLKSRDDQGKYYWELRSCIYWHEFKQPKIVYQDIARYFGMAWDESGVLLANTCYFIPHAEKWMLAVLLSSTMFYYVKKVIGSDEGGFIRLFSIHVEKFPVPALSADKQKSLTKLVDRILTAKRRDAGADVSALEREIDELVYALYGLTPEEIKLVEGAK